MVSAIKLLLIIFETVISLYLIFLLFNPTNFLTRGDYYFKKCEIVLFTQISVSKVFQDVVSIVFISEVCLLLFKNARTNEIEWREQGSDCFNAFSRFRIDKNLQTSKIIVIFGPNTFKYANRRKMLVGSCMYIYIYRLNSFCYVIHKIHLINIIIRCFKVTQK